MKILKIERLMYKHLFFDLDRTLWNYDLNSHSAFEDLFETFHLGKCFGEVDVFWKTFEKYNNMLWEAYKEGQIRKETLRVRRFELTMEELGVPDHDLAEKLNHDFLKISPMKKSLMEGTIEVLEYLKGKSYKLYILTNGFTHIQQLKLKNSGIESYFLKLFTSDKAHFSKPNAGIFSFALNSVNARKNESLMIGDDLRIDILGAKSYGMDQVYFNAHQIAHDEKVTYEIVQLLELKTFL